MIETSGRNNHIAAIISTIGEPLGFNMPWTDCLMPVHDDYHAIERAVNSAAVAGCDTIWVVLYREAQPIIRKKLGEWIYDPESRWVPGSIFESKKEIPIYYIAVNPRDRKRRDSNAWGCLYGANVVSYTSKKISKWVLPKRFLVISPYGVVADEAMKAARQILRGDHNILFTDGYKTFLDNEYMPFTFDDDVYESCRIQFRDEYTGSDLRKTYSDIFSPTDIKKYARIKMPWFYNISTWAGYSKFTGSIHNSLCSRPPYMVGKKWYGLVKSS